MTDVYVINGYKNRKEYLEDLANEYDCSLGTVLAVVCLLLFAGCARELDTPATKPPDTVAVSLVVDTPTQTPTPTPEPDPWTDEDVEAIARTLAGECYEDKPHDKRQVAEVILNRVSHEKWWGDCTAAPGCPLKLLFLRL